MFSLGNIVYINKFEFEDGTSKPKYLVVLHNESNQTIIASLTTSKDYVPDSLKKPGCIKDVPSCIHCYLFPKGTIICNNGYAFPEETFIQVERNIREKSISELNQKYVTTSKATLQGTLTPKYLKSLIDCIKSSDRIPRKIKRQFGSNS